MITNRNFAHKIIDVKFNEYTGESICYMMTDYGVVIGKAKLHPDDKPSRFLGCEIAERRAYVKGLKLHLHSLQSQYKIMNTYYDTISQKKGFNPKTNEANHARRFLEHLNNEIRYCRAMRDYINDSLEGMLERYDKDKEKIRKKYIDKENAE